MNEIARHVIYRGHVQGVGFRFTVHRIARRYAVTGTVRNLPDGTVEMHLQGPAGDVQACLHDIQKTMAGYIRQTKTDAVPPDPRHVEFQIAF